MSDTLPQADALRLEKTQTIREAIIKKLLVFEANGFDIKDLPSTPSELSLLTATLNSMDKNIYDKAKLKIEESTARSTKETNAMFASILTSISIDNGGGARTGTPLLDNDEIDDIVPGELDQGTVIVPELPKKT